MTLKGKKQFLLTKKGQRRENWAVLGEFGPDAFEESLELRRRGPLLRGQDAVAEVDERRRRLQVLHVQAEHVRVVRVRLIDLAGEIRIQSNRVQIGKE